MDLREKIVLLTGGTSGIGRALADQLRAKGAIVVVTGRTPERLADARKAGFDVIEADFTSAAGVAAVVEAWGDRPLDILINNAGMGRAHDFREEDGPATDEILSDIDESMFTNVNAPIHLIVHFVEKLKRAASFDRDPMIVNVTSGLAITPTLAATYSATKAALRAYTLALRVQMKPFGIHVLEVLPPMVDTAMTAEYDMKKMSAAKCADAIVEAMEGGKTEANVGLVRALRVINSISPKLAEKVMLSR